MKGETSIIQVVYQIHGGSLPNLPLPADIKNSEHFYLNDCEKQFLFYLPGIGINKQEIGREWDNGHLCHNKLFHFLWKDMRCLSIFDLEV